MPEAPPPEEIHGLSAAWRRVLRLVLLATTDRTNALRLSRALLLSVSYLKGYEAYLIAQVITALDLGDAARLSDALTLAFANRMFLTE